MLFFKRTFWRISILERVVHLFLCKWRPRQFFILDWWNDRISADIQIFYSFFFTMWSHVALRTKNKSFINIYFYIGTFVHFWHSLKMTHGLPKANVFLLSLQIQYLIFSYNGCGYPVCVSTFFYNLRLKNNTCIVYL